MKLREKIKEKIKAFHKDESGAQVSTEVIILLAVGAGIAVALGIFAKNRMSDMETEVQNQLQEFDNFKKEGSGSGT